MTNISPAFLVTQITTFATITAPSQHKFVFVPDLREGLSIDSVISMILFHFLTKMYLSSNMFSSLTLLAVVLIVTSLVLIQ